VDRILEIMHEHTHIPTVDRGDISVKAFRTRKTVYLIEGFNLKKRGDYITVYKKKDI